MPEPLTKERVVEAALAVLDQAGIEGLTLRAVAGRLDVKAPALYWHFRDKQDLLDEMGTEIWRRVTAELTALPGGLDWAEGLREFARITRRQLLAHRDGAKTFSGTRLRDLSLLAGQEEGYREVVAQGFAPADVVRVYQLVHHFVVGFCVEEQAVAQAALGEYSLPARTEAIDAGAHPHIAATGDAVFGDPDAAFEDQLTLLVTAAGALRRK